MNITIKIDSKSIDKFLSEWREYKLHFEDNVMKRLDDEYWCRT